MSCLGESFPLWQVAIPLSYIPASAAATAVSERACGAKHVQLVSGVPVGAYWLAHYIADWLSYGVAAAAALGVLVGLWCEAV